MDMLSKLALPKLDNETFDEIIYLMSLYEEVSSTKDKRINADNRKKNILINTFDILSGMFDLDFDQKLKFTRSESNDIYLENIDNKNYKELFYELFYKCCNQYLEKAHTFKKNKIDNTIYSLSRLAILNNDNQVLNYVINSAYNNLLYENQWLIKEGVIMASLDEEKLEELMIANSDRNFKLKQLVMTYLPYEDLSYSDICNVFKCFSNDIFKKLTKNEKIHLMNLVYNYFLIDEKISMSQKYKRIINHKTSRKECISLIIEDLKEPGKTMLIMKKNRDKIKDVLSWLPTVYSNETNQENINALDGLYDLINTNNR